MDAADAKPRGRSGSETRQRGVIIPIRATFAERAKYEAEAERAGLTLSSYIRGRLDSAPETRARHRPTIDRVLIAQATAELSRVGGLLNQIARRLNFGDIEVAADLPATLAQARDAFAALLEASGRGAQR